MLINLPRQKLALELPDSPGQLIAPPMRHVPACWLETCGSNRWMRLQRSTGIRYMEHSLRPSSAHHPEAEDTRCRSALRREQASSSTTIFVAFSSLHSPCPLE